VKTDISFKIRKPLGKIHRLVLSRQLAHSGKYAHFLVGKFGVNIQRHKNMFFIKIRKRIYIISQDRLLPLNLKSPYITGKARNKKNQPLRGWVF